MVRRACCIPGVIFSFLAMALLLLTTVSTPLAWSANSHLGFVNAYNLKSGANDQYGIVDFTQGSNVNRQIQAIELGTYGYCTKSVNGSYYEFCNKRGSAYDVLLRPAVNDSSAAYESAEIQDGLTRGLVVHIVAFVFAIVSLVLALVPNLLVMLISALLHLLTGILALIAFIIDIVLLVGTIQKIHQVSPNATIVPGVGFYCALISIPLLFLAGLTVCCGRREKDSVDDYEYSSSKKPSKFNFGRKNRAAASGSVAETDNGIPLSSRNRVLNAFEESKA